MKRLARFLRGIRRKPDRKATSATVSVASNDAHRNEPTTALYTEGQDCDSGLEKLPAELRRQILSMLDLHRLKALVHASPTFHQQYLLDRRHVLSIALEVTLGSVSLDAYTVQKAENLAPSTSERLSELLNNWRKQLPHKSSFQLASAINEDEAADMVHSYFRTIVPIAKWFIEGALKVYARQVDDTSEFKPEFSNIEWQRCLRATYRFQLLCYFADYSRRVLSRDAARSNAICLFYAPEPWEGEELFSLYQSIEDFFKTVFENIAPEIHPDNPRFDDQDRPPTPVGAFEFDDPDRLRDYVEGTLLRGGLNLLFSILVDMRPNNRETIVRIMQRSIVVSYIPIDASLGILGDDIQKRRRSQALSLRDKLTAERAPLPFQGDDLCGPPLAWTIAWSSTYSNLIGYYMSNEMRRWGCVFWDADRLESHSGIDILRRQWQHCWDEDPREDL